MYGLIGKMKTQPGRRDALISLMLQGTTAMPGCISMASLSPISTVCRPINAVTTTSASHAAGRITSIKATANACCVAAMSATTLRPHCVTSMASVTTLATSSSCRITFMCLSP